MSKISFSENHESSLVAFEEGKPLASLSNPLGEALNWAYSLGAMPTPHVIIVGLGCGFHVAALADFDPGLKITVVESREALIPVFRAQFPEIADRVAVVVIQDERALFSSDLFQEQINQCSLVLSFKECWGYQTAFFSKIFAHLTGRSVEAISYHFEEFGINMKALYFQSNQLLSVKDVVPVVEASIMPENKKQIFRILNELVK